ncbi:MAG: Uma2 family endonuclease [Prosthecobacter sp.]|uniref:Uma2 family endonuclease n=1 Tax=Prosthecobacter sp. TaxID=1965333 RepID=UPI0039029834
MAVLAPLPQPTSPMRHQATVEELYRLFNERDPGETRRMELINGEIVDMLPPGPFHSGFTDEVHEVIREKVGKALRVRCQNPIRINRHNEPQPDIAVVEKRKDGYTLSHPGPDDVLLIIEISDSSLEYDLNTKRQTYAKAEIAEYWVLDVNDRELHVFRRPWQGDYTEHATFSGEDEVQCTTIRDLQLRVRELLPEVMVK